MSEQRSVPIDDLTLDLVNFRTVRQPSEADAVRAMIATKPDRFWALTKSLLADGYLPTEAVLVLKGSGRQPAMTVKEGNRRIAALKFIHGLLDLSDTDIPDEVLRLVDELSDDWKQANRDVPCVVYSPRESATVDKIVSLAHGKNEQAGRDQWNAVARARHNRDAQGGSEPGLDVLERYLDVGQDLTPRHAAQWSGDYPLTVLDEALKKLAPRLGFRNARELADAYPKVKPRSGIDGIIHAIGMKRIPFVTIRSKSADFAASYGIPQSTEDEKPTSDSSKESKVQGQGAGTAGGQGQKNADDGKKRSESGKQEAASITDPRRVKAVLDAFTPRGDGRAKVVLLRDEAKRLVITKTPLAFCFLLRSMFEISARAYCEEHSRVGGPSAAKSTGEDRKLVDVLRDITNHLTNKDKAMVKSLHGAMTELAKSDGLLSVTSMNQLVHHPTFMVGPTEICILFGNVFPLLEAMNE